MEGAASAANASPKFASLYVGDLKPEVTEAMLYEIFNSVGPVASIRVCRNSVTRRSLGYGYVNFNGVADAERALDTLNYSSIKGRSCRIMWSQRDAGLRKSSASNVYVKDLDKTIDNKALYDTFSLFGNILSCKVASDANGNSYGYGFVHYETDEAATQAIERVNGMQIGEKPVQVCLLEKQKVGPPDTENYTNVYIKSFPGDWDEAKLEEFFSVVGKVCSCARRTDNRGRPFAFVSFDRPEDAKKAVETLNKKDLRSEDEITAEKDAGKEPELAADGHPVHGIYVGRAQTKVERKAELGAKFQPNHADVNIYIKNLDETMDDDALRALFEPFGGVKSVSVPKDESGKCKGFGFICFTNSNDATVAVTEMHLKVVSEKPLYVSLAESKEVREGRKQRGKGEKGGKGNKGGKDLGQMMPPQGFGLGGGMMPTMPMMPMMGGNGMPPQMMGKGGMPGMVMGPHGPIMGGQRGPSPQQMMAMLASKGKGMPGMGMMGMMGKGGLPGMGMPMPQQRPGQLPSAPNVSLNSAMLAAAPPAVQKQMIGEKLYQIVSKHEPDLAGKITGMMLEMRNSELLGLMDSEAQMKSKIDEAMRVLTSEP